MQDTITIAYRELEDAYAASSGDGGHGIAVWISKADGRIHWEGSEGALGDDDELPEDLGDPDRYWQVPDQGELDLGSRLVFRFVRDVMPADYDAVADIFRRRGAYSGFKALLDRRGMLQRWYDYENEATREALLAWAAECGFEVTGVPQPGKPG